MTITRTIIPAHHGWALRAFTDSRHDEFWISEPEAIIAWIVEVELRSDSPGDQPEPFVWPITCEGSPSSQSYLIVAPDGQVTVPLSCAYDTLEAATVGLREEWEMARASRAKAAAA